MRILHLYKAYPPVSGGIENTVALLARGQAAVGHQVTVLVSGPGHRTTVSREHGVEVVRLARLAEIASTPLSPSLPWHLLGQRPDIAHLHAPFPPAEVAQILFGRARRTVITWHSDVVRQQRILRVYAPILRRVLARADRIFPTSQAYLDRSRFLRSVRNRCEVIPLGLPLDRFCAPADPARVAALRRAWCGPGEDAPRPEETRSPHEGARRDPDARAIVLFVGRLRAYKGLPYLIQAMRPLRACCVIAGQGPEGASLRDLASRLGVAHRVRFPGHLAEVDLPAAYQAADVFVLPSHLPSEAFGLVSVEAMASGLPVVATELGTGTSEVVRHEDTGLVVPPADAAALSTALARLLADPALRRRLGAAGRDRARERYSAEAYLRRTEDAYRRVLSSPHRFPVTISNQ